MKKLLCFFLISFCWAELLMPTPYDLDWSNFQTLTIGGLEIGHDDLPNIDKATLPLCFCGFSPGIPIEFWEPVKLIEVVTKPYHFPLLLNWGGEGDRLLKKIERRKGITPTGAGYHYHIYHWPILRFAKDLSPHLFQCLDQGMFGLEYMSEIDPSHNNATIASLLTPEVGAVLLNNTLAIAAEGSCIVDTLHIQTQGEPLDFLYFCAGREGCLFPLTGDIAVNRGALRNSYLIAMRALFKMHRLSGLTQAKHGTLDKEAACGSYCQMTMRRHQYKLQLLYPKPLKPYTVFLGQSIDDSILPVGTRHFDASVWIVWRKRYCCALYDERLKSPLA